MKHCPVLLPFLTLLIGCRPNADTDTASTNSDKAETAEASFLPIAKGTNFSHWLSQSGRRGAEREAFITETDFAFIAASGFDYVRIPVDEELLNIVIGQQQ